MPHADNVCLGDLEAFACLGVVVGLPTCSLNGSNVMNRVANILAGEEHIAELVLEELASKAVG